jgi:hypothetical protein
MSKIHFHQTTMRTPAQYIAGLTDFGPGRSEVSSKSTDDYLKVHSLSATEADVTEGSGGVWERLHYDWSDRTHVTLRTTESNTWANTSGYTYTFSEQDVMSDVKVDVVREGKNAKGHVLAAVLRAVGKGVLGKAFVERVTAIETRDNAVPAR